ncbi:MAG TPA: VWA domain-containing protein [Candidatus Binataceae bacterium]
MMTTLRDNLIGFIASLRAAGIRISVAESIDAMNAVAAAGLARARMREALAAAVIKDEGDRATFDEHFGRFFAPPAGAPRERSERSGQQLSAASGKGRPSDQPSGKRSERPRGSRATGGPETPDDAEPDRDDDATPEREAEADAADEHEQRGDAAQARADLDEGERKHDREGAERPSRSGDDDAPARCGHPRPGVDATRLARLRALERLPFDQFSDLDYDAARDALAPLARRFKVRLGRRLRLARAGRLDFRRTIRAAVQRGGALADLRFRARRPRHVDLVILADISGSVHYAAQLMLELVAGARECFRRVRSFVYIDHLAEAGFEQGHLVMTPALDFYARSDFGRVLGELWAGRVGLLNRQTLVVIMGDGRNNRLPARADLLREIARTARAVVWLNPEEPERWGRGDSAINLYAREVKALLPSRNLRELERALLRVA